MSQEETFQNNLPKVPDNTKWIKILIIFLYQPTWIDSKRGALQSSLNYVPESFMMETQYVLTYVCMK